METCNANTRDILFKKQKALWNGNRSYIGTVSSWKPQWLWDFSEKPHQIPERCLRCGLNVFASIVFGISSIIAIMSCDHILTRTLQSHIQFVLAWPWTTRSSCTRCWTIPMRPARWRAPPLRMPLLSWTMWQRTVTRTPLWSCSCCETIWPSGHRTRRPEIDPFPGRDRVCKSSLSATRPIRSGTLALNGWRALGRWGEPDRATHKNHAQKELSAAALQQCCMPSLMLQCLEVLLLRQISDAFLRPWRRPTHFPNWQDFWSDHPWRRQTPTDESSQVSLLWILTKPGKLQKLSYPHAIQRCEWPIYFDHLVIFLSNCWISRGYLFKEELSDSFRDLVLEVQKPNVKEMGASIALVVIGWGTQTVFACVCSFGWMILVKETYFYILFLL